MWGETSFRRESVNLDCTWYKQQSQLNVLRKEKKQRGLRLKWLFKEIKILILLSVLGTIFIIYNLLQIKIRICIQPLWNGICYFLCNIWLSSCFFNRLSSDTWTNFYWDKRDWTFKYFKNLIKYFLLTGLSCLLLAIIKLSFLSLYLFFFIKEQTYLRIQSFEFTLQFVHKYIIIKVSIFLQVYCFIFFLNWYMYILKKTTTKRNQKLWAIKCSSQQKGNVSYW